MFLEKIKSLPFIKPLFYFPKRCHKQAFKKFAILWFMCTLPVILTVLFTQKPESKASIWIEFFNNLLTFFSAPEQFVYTAAFLPPVIYLLYERYQEAEMDNNMRDRIKLSVRKVFDGYDVILVFACLALLTTITTYTGTKTNLANLQNTYFYALAVSSAPWCYFFSLYCWYLSILDGIHDSSTFLSDTKNAEDNLSGLLSDRIKAREIE